MYSVAGPKLRRDRTIVSDEAGNDGAVGLLLCLADEASNDFVHIPYQRDAIRKFADSEQVALQGEIICQLTHDFDATQLSMEIAAQAMEKQAQTIIVTRINLLNESGLASTLIAELSAHNIKLVGV